MIIPEGVTLTGVVREKRNSKLLPCWMTRPALRKIKENKKRLKIKD